MLCVKISCPVTDLALIKVMDALNLFSFRLPKGAVGGTTHCWLKKIYFSSNSSNIAKHIRFVNRVVKENFKICAFFLWGVESI